jgi:hypothetical protein
VSSTHAADPAGPTGPKVCTACRVARPRTEFHRSRSRRDGLHDRCKPCTCAAQAARYRTDPERHRSRQRAAREADPERFRAYSRRSRTKDPEKNRARCRTRYRANPEKFRIARLGRHYGLTPESVEAVLREQRGRCAICGRAEGSAEPRTGKRVRLAPDHDHACCPGERSCGRCIRGLLCATCNTGLGMFHDNPEHLARAIDDLRRAR